MCFPEDVAGGSLGEADILERLLVLLDHQHHGDVQRRNRGGEPRLLSKMR